MTEQELNTINKFRKNISKKSRKKIEETFDLMVDVYKSNLLMDCESFIITKKERMYFIESYWDYKTPKSKYMSEKFQGCIDITELDDEQINDLKKNGWNTANLKTTYKKVKNHPDYVQAKRKANIESLKC